MERNLSNPFPANDEEVEVGDGAEGLVLSH
jgi:hypothetical protein